MTDTNEYQDLIAVRELIKRTCNELASFLIEKNRKYGNSALKPVRVFSKVDAEEQLNVRMDDKLSRIANNASGEDEDPIWDLAGYLILKLVKRKMENNNE